MDERDLEIERLRAELAQVKSQKVDGGMGKLAAAANREAAEYRTLMSGGDVSAPQLVDVSREAADFAFSDWYPRG